MIGTFLSMAAWELKLQTRALRTRVGIGVYLLVCCGAPWLLRALVGPLIGGWNSVLSGPLILGPMTYLHATLAAQGGMTVLLALAVAGNRTTGNSWRELWPVLGASPMSSALYLFSRWLSIFFLLLPVTVLPLLMTAAVVYVEGHGAFINVPVWVLGWAFNVALILATVTAGWLGLLTIFRSEMAALLFSIFAPKLFLKVINELIFPLRMFVKTGAVGDSLNGLGQWITSMQWLANKRSGSVRWIARSETPWAVAQDIAEKLAPSLLTFGLSLLTLAVGSLFVARSRRDIRPRPFRPDHPLRTYGKKFHEVRQALSPAAAPGFGEKIAVALGAALFCTALGGIMTRQANIMDLAEEHYQIQANDSVAPTAPGVEVKSWHIQGNVDDNGFIATESFGVIKNHGNETVTRLAFDMDANVQIEEARVGAAVVAPKRQGGRIELILPLPLGPDAETEISFRVSGQPGVHEFKFWGRRGATFPYRYERHLKASRPYDIDDFSASRFLPDVTPERLSLRVADISPFLRTTPWTLSRKDDETLMLDVPDQEVRQPIELSVDLELPNDAAILDTCGNAKANKSPERLQGGCSISLGKYHISGGNIFELVRPSDKIALMILPIHREIAELYSEQLITAVERSRNVWPDIEGYSEGLGIIEEVPWLNNNRMSMSWMVSTGSRVWLLHERMFGERMLPMPNELVANQLRSQLNRKRRIVQDDALLIRFILQHLVDQRMGTARQKDGRVSGPPWLKQTIRDNPILTSMKGNNLISDQRLPAVLIELENRVGPRPFIEGFSEFLSAPGEGSFEELIETLEKHGNVNLDQLVADFFEGGALPELELAEVRSDRRGTRFAVQGEVHNKGTGEVHCPVFVKTETGEKRIQLKVGGQDVAKFSVTTDARPHTVELDPDGLCHRLVGPNSAASERVDLLG